MLFRPRDAQSLLFCLHITVLQIQNLLHSCQILTPNINHLCGQINVHTHSPFALNWKLNLLRGYSTKLIYHRLNTLYSKRCEINSVTLQKGQTCHYQDHYCGYLPPWNESFSGSNIIIIVNINLPSPSAQFILSYYLFKVPQLTSQTVMYILGNSKSWASLKVPMISDILQDMTVYVFTQKSNILKITTRSPGRWSTLWTSTHEMISFWTC